MCSACVIVPDGSPADTEATVPQAVDALRAAHYQFNLECKNTNVQHFGSAVLLGACVLLPLFSDSRHLHEDCQLVKQYLGSMDQQSCMFVGDPHPRVFDWFKHTADCFLS